MIKALNPDSLEIRRGGYEGENHKSQIMIYGNRKGISHSYKEIEKRRKKADKVK